MIAFKTVHRKIKTPFRLPESAADFNVQEKTRGLMTSRVGDKPARRSPTPAAL